MGWERRREKGRRGRRRRSQERYGYYTMELVWKCYNFVWKLLEYGLLGFSMDISFVPFLGFC